MMASLLYFLSIFSGNVARKMFLFCFQIVQTKQKYFNITSAENMEKKFHFNKTFYVLKGYNNIEKISYFGKNNLLSIQSH